MFKLNMHSTFLPIFSLFVNVDGATRTRGHMTRLVTEYDGGHETRRQSKWSNDIRRTSERANSHRILLKLFVFAPARYIVRCGYLCWPLSLYLFFSFYHKYPSQAQIDLNERKIKILFAIENDGRQILPFISQFATINDANIVWKSSRRIYRKNIDDARVHDSWSSWENIDSEDFILA